MVVYLKKWLPTLLAMLLGVCVGGTAGQAVGKWLEKRLWRRRDEAACAHLCTPTAGPVCMAIGSSSQCGWFHELLSHAN